MTHSLSDILLNRDFDEPLEGKAIKKFVRDEFGATVAVTVREKDIIIEVPGAALTNTLRLRQTQLKKAAATDKKLIFRIH